MEQKVEIRKIDNIKTQTGLRKIMDKGEVVETKLITKVTFEAEMDPHEVSQIHRLIQGGHEVNIDVSSPQLIMKGLETET
ncbi:hypothetical protein ES703_05398 [subsurface metagenome]